ncbi:MAG: STAS domain-containing protein [Lachnospiraceae bacterium]|nr:STAS domain-containing protein [Lachnospiraceae bacterium]
MKETLTYRTPERLDTVTAPDVLEQLLALAAEEPEGIVIEMEDTVYISSMGLRALLQTQKELEKKGGKMSIRGVKPMVANIFEVTGFSQIFTICG